MSPYQLIQDCSAFLITKARSAYLDKCCVGRGFLCRLQGCFFRKRAYLFIFFFKRGHENLMTFLLYLRKQKRARWGLPRPRIVFLQALQVFLSKSLVASGFPK